MDAILRKDVEQETGRMTRVSGITGLKDYLEQIAPSRPMEPIWVENITKKELQQFQKPVIDYIQTLCDSMDFRGYYNFQGNPIILSLAIKDYQNTDKLLDSLGQLSIRKCGLIQGQAYGFGLAYDFDCQNNEYSILNLLYEPEFIAQGEIRNKILSRLAKEADDLYDFSLKQTKSFHHKVVKERLVQDKKDYPELFQYKTVCYAPDMASLLFLMRVFQDVTYRNQLLSNNSVGLYSYINPQIDQKGMISAEIKQLGQLVAMLVDQEETHKELLCFLLKIITQLRVRRNMDSQNEAFLTEIEKSVWNIVGLIPISEDTLIATYSKDANKKFNTELIYEYASRRNGHKLDFYVDELFSIEHTFGLWVPEDLSFQMGFCLSGGVFEITARLFRLVNDVGTFRYDEAALQTDKQLGREIGNFLTRNSEQLKDVFMELLIKGFVPPGCLDTVIQKVNNNKRCMYMRPLLIAYKYGGLKDDEG